MLIVINKLHSIEIETIYIPIISVGVSTYTHNSDDMKL